MRDLLGDKVLLRTVRDALCEERGAEGAPQRALRGQLGAQAPWRQDYGPLIVPSLRRMDRASQARHQAGW